MDAKKLAELIYSLRWTPERLAVLVASLPSSEQTRKPAPETFSVREHIHHLRDLEVEGYAVRLRRLLHENNPSLPDIDGTRLAHERAYNQHSHEEALQEFTHARLSCLSELERLRPEDWQRAGQLESVGQVSVARLLELWWEHDRTHLAELDRLAEKVSQEPSPC